MSTHGTSAAIDQSLHAAVAGSTSSKMNAPQITLDDIATKVRARRPVKNLSGERISLTNQQASIVRCMCQQGLLHKQIAADLGITEREVSMIVSSVMRLAVCKTHAQFGAWAAKVGLA